MGTIKVASIAIVSVILFVTVIGFLAYYNGLISIDPGGFQVQSSASVLEGIRHVNKLILIEHYNAVDITYTEAPENWTKMLGLKQEFVVLVRGRVPAGFDLAQLQEDDIWVSEDGKAVPKK